MSAKSGFYCNYTYVCLISETISTQKVHSANNLCD